MAWQWSHNTFSLRWSASLVKPTSKILQASPYWAMRRSVLRSPEPPIKMGGWGFCTDGGEVQSASELIVLPLHSAVSAPLPGDTWELLPKRKIFLVGLHPVG